MSEIDLRYFGEPSLSSALAHHGRQPPLPAGALLRCCDP